MSISHPQLVVILLSDQATQETIASQVNKTQTYINNKQGFVIIITTSGLLNSFNEKLIYLARKLVVESIPECAIFLGNNKIHDWIEIARKVNLYPEKDIQQRIVFTA